MARALSALGQSLPSTVSLSPQQWPGYPHGQQGQEAHRFLPSSNPTIVAVTGISIRPPLADTVWEAVVSACGTSSWLPPEVPSGFSGATNVMIDPHGERGFVTRVADDHSKRSKDFF